MSSLNFFYLKVYKKIGKHGKLGNKSLQIASGREKTVSQICDSGKQREFNWETRNCKWRQDAKKNCFPNLCQWETVEFNWETILWENWKTAGNKINKIKIGKRDFYLPF